MVTHFRLDSGLVGDNRPPTRVPLVIAWGEELLEVTNEEYPGESRFTHKGLHLKNTGQTLREVHHLEAGFSSYEAAGYFLANALPGEYRVFSNSGILQLSPQLVFLKQTHHQLDKFPKPDFLVTQNWELWIDHKTD